MTSDELHRTSTNAAIRDYALRRFSGWGVVRCPQAACIIGTPNITAHAYASNTATVDAFVDDFVPPSGLGEEELDKTGARAHKDIDSPWPP